MVKEGFLEEAPGCQALTACVMASFLPHHSLGRQGLLLSPFTGEETEAGRFQ